MRTDSDGTELGVINSTDYIENIGGTLAHELGHVLGLAHTHDAARLSTSDDNGSVYNGCYQESVSRVKQNYWHDGCGSTNNQLKCEINGDQLCDTPADPNMNKFLYNDDPLYSSSTDLPPCSYSLPSSGDYRTDNWNFLWQPNARNIMAYSNQKCRNFFSPDQIAIMQHTLDTDWSNVTLELTVSKSAVCYNQTATVAMPTSYGQYTNSNIHGASYQWDIGTGITIASGQGTNKVTIKGNSSSYNGYSSTHVHVTSPTGEFCMPTSVWVGPPSTPASISGNINACTGSTEYYFSSTSTSATSYQWSLSRGGTGWSIEDQNFNQARVKIGTSYTYLRTQALNTCGASGLRYLLLSGNDDCGGCNEYLTLSPNPSTSGDINLKIIAPCGIESTFDAGKSEEYSINLYDENGKNIYSFKSTKKDIKIDKVFKSGKYLINVTHKDKIITEWLIVE